LQLITKARRREEVVLMNDLSGKFELLPDDEMGGKRSGKEGGGGGC
jgi:hypothetical protein